MTAGSLAAAAHPPYVYPVVTRAQIPPAWVECGYYVMVVYSTMGDALEISLPVPATAILALLAARCVSSLQACAGPIYRPIAPVVACGVSYLVVQLFVHREPIGGEYVRPFMSWMLMLVISHSLAMRRGFLHRFALATFAMGAYSLAFFELYDTFNRLSIFSRVSFGNSNDLAAWFGFTCVYFIVTAFETRSNIIRLASASLAVFCLVVVGLTVSRGALLAIAVAALIVFGRVLRAGLFSVLLVAFACVGVYESGIFRDVAVSYANRGSEETGRLVVWPLVLQRIADAPLVGVGASNVATEAPGASQPITPHNAFLFLALGSGLLPAFFLASFWWKSVHSVVRSRRESRGLAAYRAPLLAYVLLIIQTGNMPLAPWVFVVTGIDVSPRWLRVGAQAEQAEPPPPATRDSQPKRLRWMASRSIS
jgi:O-antigen ligase